MASAERPTYEQLEEIIRRKDKAVLDCYWNAHTIWAIAWLAYQGHESGNADFDNELYAEASAYLMKHIAGQARAMQEELDEKHKLAGVAGSQEVGAVL